jgi:hypothetical protein
MLVAKPGSNLSFLEREVDAYWPADTMASAFDANAGTVFLIPSAGGHAEPLRSNLMDAGVPQW